MGRSKPKRNEPSDTSKSNPRDRCQTPPYAVNPLLPYLPDGAVIWEPAAGEGLLVATLESHGYKVYFGDILTGQNFFAVDPPQGSQFQVTNMPFSIKFEWLKRSYELGLPFALLGPLETLGSGKCQRLFREYGVEVIVMDQRIDYKMPDKGWCGSGAQFPSAWFTWNLNIGSPLTFSILNKPPKPLFLAEMQTGLKQLALFS